jgi:hypothetical protein
MVDCVGKRILRSIFQYFWPCWRYWKTAISERLGRGAQAGISAASLISVRQKLADLKEQPRAYIGVPFTIGRR